MDKKDFKNRLECMYDEMNFTNNRALELLTLINDTNLDKEELLSKIYFSEKSPLKVINYMFEPKGQGDITGEMINVSIKYDNFVRDMNDYAQAIINKHTNAVELFLIVLSLPSPYALLLYLRYYKKMTNENVMNRMFLSRTTYYRLYDQAVNLAMNKYLKGERV